MSCIRYFNEAVVEYFKTISIEDGDIKRTPQIALAIPSRQGLSLKLNNENTPIMPIIVVTRNGLGLVNESYKVRKHIIRPIIYSLNTNTRIYNGIDIMPCLYNYQIDYMALYQDMFDSMTEQIMFKLIKYNYVKTFISLNNHTIHTNAIIQNVSYSDSTSYNQIADETNRIFKGNFNFTLYGFITNDEYSINTVLDTKNQIKVVTD